MSFVERSTWDSSRWAKDTCPTPFSTHGIGQIKRVNSSSFIISEYIKQNKRWMNYCRKISFKMPKAQGTEGRSCSTMGSGLPILAQQNRCWSVEITKVRNFAESLYFFVLIFDICFGNNVFKRLQPACYRCRWVGAITLLLGILTLHTNLLPAFSLLFLLMQIFPSWVLLFS